MNKQKCDYCNKKKKHVSPMLSNGYHKCQDCSDEPIETLETMAQHNENERTNRYKNNLINALERFQCIAEESGETSEERQKTQADYNLLFNFIEQRI